MPDTLPYGSWPSPITAEDLTAGSHPVSGARFVGDEVWWSELRPDEGGRYAILRQGASGPVTVLPAPWNARTRVHEYGGSCWTVTGDGALVFTEFTDQRLYRLDPGAAEPTPLTGEPAVPAGARYAEPRIVEGRLWCIRERHDDTGAVARDICAIPLDGSAADDDTRVETLVTGATFFANPRLSPDGRRLAFLAWDHPQMPWDGTELRVADRQPDGSFGAPRTLLGSPTESVLQPEWQDEDTLRVISDRSGWWNLYTIPADGGTPHPLYPAEADFAGPLWQLGATWHADRGDGTVLIVRTRGTDTLGILDPATGTLTNLALPEFAAVSLGPRSGDTLLLLASGAKIASGLRRLDLSTGAVTDVRLAVDALPDPVYLPDAQLMTFTGQQGREVHAVVYPPHNPDATAPDGELPPYIAFIHGGPTAHVTPGLDLAKAFFTSRGLGVVDVNYGGSTGYGREYRERLRGQWGVVDVEDTVTALRGLVDAGLADESRLAIEGGSAGGWTVLAALTGTDVFACGASYFGVAELIRFAEDTHDFESRYLDGLIGPLPEMRDLYVERAPLSHVDGLSCPVLLLQGLDDPIVPPSQAEMFRDAMVAKGIPHAYREYAGESHGFRRAATIVDARNSELSFYGQVMGFEPPGIPVLPLWRPGAGD